MLEEMGSGNKSQRQKKGGLSAWREKGKGNMPGGARGSKRRERAGGVLGPEGF